jgi:hypothetical protein
MTERAVTFTARMVNRTTPQVQEVVGGLDRMRRATQGVVQSNVVALRTNQSWMRGMSENRRIVQQLGFQLTDFTTQVAGGQSALLAFIQQGGQVLQFFGATGAVLATLLTVFGTMGLVFLRSGQSLATLTPILGVLHDEFVTLTAAVRAFGSFMVDVANVVLNNLDSLLVSATLVGTYFAAGWVGSMISAQIATLALATATVRATAMQNLAAAVTISYVGIIQTATTSLAVYRGMVLAAAASTVAFAAAGFAAVGRFIASLFTLRGAMTAVYVLMGGPLIEALARFVAIVTVTAVSAVLSLYVAFVRLSGVAIMGLVSALGIGTGATMRFGAALTLVNIQAAAVTATAAILRGVMVVWAAVTSAAVIGQMALSAALSIGNVAVLALAGAFRLLTFAILATGIGALVIGLGALITGLYRAREALGSWSGVWIAVKDVAVEAFGRIGTLVTEWIPAQFRVGMNSAKAWFVGAVADMLSAFTSLTSSIAEGFNSLFGTELQGLGTGLESTLRGWVDTYSRQAENARNSAGNWMEAITAPMDALNTLRDAMSDDTSFDVRDWFGGGAGAEEATGGAQTTANRIADIYKQTARSISDSFKSAFKGLIDGSKSASDVVKEMLGSILDRIYDIMMTPVFDNIARMVTGGIFRLTGTPMPATIPSFAGGGQTRAGVRAGGVDGKGGTLMIGHPNETIVDETVRSGARGGYSAGGAMRVQNIVNNYGSEPVTQETQTGPDGEMLLITTIGKAIAQGKLDGALSSRLQTKTRTIAR